MLRRCFDDKIDVEILFSIFTCCVFMDGDYSAFDKHDYLEKHRKSRCAMVF